MFHFKNTLLRLFFFSLLFIPLLKAEETTKVIINNNIKDIHFNVEVVRKKIERERGLMFRKSLNLNRGMLFIFPNESKINMWMKNTLISLDIIFISKNYKIVDIIKNTKAMSKDILTSSIEAKYALEINAGLVKKLNIKIGNNINFEEVK